MGWGGMRGVCTSHSPENTKNFLVYVCMYVHCICTYILYMYLCECQFDIVYSTKRSLQFGTTAINEYEMHIDFIYD